MSDKESCATCRFFKDADPKSYYGCCRRYPPQVISEVKSRHGTYTDEPIQDLWSDPDTHFPKVLQNEWCGEFKKQEPL